MSALNLDRNRVLPDSSAVQELDVTPVMNLFIILIPFLVSMAVFTHLATIQFSLPPNVNAGLDQTAGKPTVKLTVVLAPSYVAVTQGDQMLDSIPVNNGDHDFMLLKERLPLRRAETTVPDEVIIAVRDAVKFKNVVRVMDICKESGFTKLGVSNATELPGEGV